MSRGAFRTTKIYISPSADPIYKEKFPEFTTEQLTKVKRLYPKVDETNRWIIEILYKLRNDKKFDELVDKGEDIEFYLDVYKEQYKKEREKLEEISLVKFSSGGVECKKCSGTNTETTEYQSKRSDEPATVKVKCRTCGYESKT